MPYLSIQWHITADCQQNCPHCYVRNEKTYESEKNNPLSLKEGIAFLNNFKKSCREMKHNVLPAISLTGGDPLLRKDFFKILAHAHKLKIPIRILGNSYLLNKKTIAKLKKCKVFSYQISLDGLEKTHNSFRKKGSFKDAFRAFKLLNKAKIRTNCMMTLSKLNAKDIIPLMRIVNNKVSCFSFSRLVPTGNGKNLEKELFTPKQYRAILVKIWNEQEKLKKSGSKTHWDRKDHLFTLLEYEKGIMKPVEDGIIHGSCGMGIRHLSMLADGTIVICRRMPVQIGNVRKNSIKNIFLHAKKLEAVRKINNYTKCRNCELLRYCRGCPAVAYATTGDVFAPDPQCWKKVKGYD